MATRAKKTPAKTTKKPATAKKPAVKKTTKAKSTTVKSKSTKAAVVNTAKKSTEKAQKTTKSATVSTSVKKPNARRELTPFEKLRSLHISSFISFVLLGLISFFLIGKAGSEILLSYQARDNFTSNENVVLGSASEILLTLDYRYLIITALAIGAVGSLLLASSLRKRYENSVVAGISGFRWLIYGLSGAVVAELVSLMAGVQDIMTLKVVGGLVILAALLGWISERENKGISNSRLLAYYGSIFAYFLALLPIIGSFIGTTLYGNERFGWNVYALAGVLLLSFVAILWMQKSAITKKSKFEYIVFEQRYIRIDQITKFLVVVILLASLNN